MSNFSAESGYRQDNIDKLLHEEFVKNLNGTTIEETFLTIYSAPFLIFISLVCVSHLFPNLHYSDKFSFISLRQILLIFLVELFFIILPLILTYTILSEFLGIVFFVSLFISFYIVVIHVSIPGGSLYWKKPNLSDLLSVSIKGQKRSFLTNFRSLINAITAICILAVDFDVFPRRFAKTETFGYGLMDIGVGLFIIANSVVLKSQSNKHKSLRSTVYGSSVLVVLGLIRYFSVSKINYQTHITEYGVHWNFFFTLALTQLISKAILFFDILFRNCYFISLFLVVFHQFILSYGLEGWVLNETSRSTLLDANKEGIASLTGYVGLYLAGVSIGNFITTILPTVKSELKLIGKLIFGTILFYCLTIYLETVFPASRRLVNITYITWVVGVTLMVLFLCNMIDVLAKCLLKNVSNKESDYYVPVILQSISYNGLFFFLLANIITGLINVLCITISMDVFSSLSILIGYMVVLCGISELLYHKNIKIKFW